MRNRGTIGGNVCSNDPTNHLPPLMVALGATMTIAAPTASGGAGGGVLPRRLHDRRRPGELLTRITCRPGGPSDGFAAVTLGNDGTCIVNAAASVERRRRASRSAASTRCRCVRRDASGRRDPEGRPRGGRGPARPRPAVRRARVGRLPPHLAEVLAVRAVLQAAASEELTRGAPATDSPQRRGHDQRHDLRARGRGAPAARALPPRRPRPHRHPHRLRHRQLRRLHGDRRRRAVKSCMLLAVQADGASIGRSRASPRTAS